MERMITIESWRIHSLLVFPHSIMYPNFTGEGLALIRWWVLGVNLWSCSFSRFGKCWKYSAGNIWCSRAINRNETHVNHHFALMMGSQKWTENEEQFNFGIQQLLFPLSYERMRANPLQKAAMRQIRQSNMRRKGQEIYFFTW